VSPSLDRPSVSPLTVNRLSIYLRCLEELLRQGIDRISSTELAARFHLSASQIRKDLAHLGELGTRGVGYPVGSLVARLRSELGLDGRHGLVIVGIGNLGSALAAYPGFDSDGFRVVGLFDSDPAKTGRRVGRLEIRPTQEISGVVRRTGAVLGVLTVPAEGAQRTHDLLVAAGIRAILNFAPRRLSSPPDVRVKNVDLRINLEELSFFLSRTKEDRSRMKDEG
jgi:redox-sensing transcriptional repressor